MTDEHKRKTDSFTEFWDQEYIEISHEGIVGDFYPNERGLVVCRKQIKEKADLDKLVVDGDFDLRDNFDDEFYGFAHITWQDGSWTLASFTFDLKTSTESQG
ncbi:MAG: hypothetical protein OEZ36_05570 [Spirochaetota bacterium]|nr:hypothetical protein [Spirochaetota bacterium]